MNIIFLILKCLFNDAFNYMLSKTKEDVIRPMMQYKEIIIIEEILKNMRPSLCLEWGAGYSTIYFSQHLYEDAKWIAVEHDKNWYIKIKELTHQNKHISLFYVPPNNYQWLDINKDGSFSDFKDYITFPKKINSKFDFILVDGRARKYCLIFALDLLNDKGVIVLHDANREYYHDPFKHYSNHVMFLDFRKNSGGLWIGSKGINLYNILNINKHKLNWEIINKFLKLKNI